MKKRLILYFFALEILACGVVFGPALWGAKLMAPLDIAPAFFSRFRDVEPNPPAIPANHQIIDQLTYDLPIQWTIYKAYRAGEIPWWDPYTFAGRPLLADAHINGTDPFRILAYRLLPFELAYNWTLIAHSILAGVAMLLLLARFRFADWQCVLLAIAWQFSGAFVLQIGHPWIEASLAWYPLLWLCWDKWMVDQSWGAIAAGSLFLALIFYAGNLQSHSYTIIFTAAFLLGYAGRLRSQWLLALRGLIPSFLFGLLLAAPVLASQLEFFLIGARTVGHPFNPFGYLGALASLSAIYPWAFGTFRTIDISKLADQGLHYGFALFVGSVVVCLAFLGLRAASTEDPRLRPIRNTALWTLLFYLILISTPLVNFVYLRCSALAAMALLLLAGCGLRAIFETPVNYRPAARWVGAGAAVILIVTHVFAWIVYPRLAPAVAESVRSYRIDRLGNAQALRSFQIENFPAETTIRNPEVVFAALGLFFLAALLAFNNRSAVPWIALLLLNAVPGLLFAHRFIPHQPAASWHRLLAGGAEQQKLASILGGTSLRLNESVPRFGDHVFPKAMSHLYQVRTVHGYSALQPHSLPLLASAELGQLRDQVSDLEFRSTESLGLSQIITNHSSGFARFQWNTPSHRPFFVRHDGLNTIQVHFDAGQPGTFLWTDTFYPGWKGSVDGHRVNLKKKDPCFTSIEIPGTESDLILRYQPTYLRAGLVAAGVGLVGLISCVVAGLSLRPSGAAARARRNFPEPAAELQLSRSQACSPSTGQPLSMKVQP